MWQRLVAILLALCNVDHWLEDTEVRCTRAPRGLFTPFLFRMPVHRIADTLR